MAGRPTLLNDDLKDRLVATAEIMFHYKWIAAACGISRQALEDYRKIDPDLEARLDQARSKFIKNHMRKAKSDFMLATADRETFGQKAELSVTGGENPINVLLQAYGIDPKKLSEGETNAGQDDGVISTPPQD